MNWWTGVQSQMVRRARNRAIIAGLLLLAAAPTLLGRGKDKLPYGEGLIVNIPLPAIEVEQVVEDVAQNGVIRGTKEYNKDEFVAGAKAATSARVFPAWDQEGKVFYKIREGAIDPRNFKDSGDVGTLAVRYVVAAQGEKNTVLRIDALFQEDFRRTVHQSNGSVESAEYKDIQEHLEAIEVMKKQNIEAQKERQEQLATRRTFTIPSNDRAVPTPSFAPPDEPQETENRAAPAPRIETAQATSTAPLANTTPPASTPQPTTDAPQIQSVPGQTLEERVKNLRREVARMVKAPGAPLKSAPFHTASTLQSLTAGTEVLILISTPYWYGVETHEGQHGWIMRDQLEQR
ncbi:MAG: hypothetical protein WBC78_20240 [Candidatus Sulfotelmatobacter sp.]